MKGFFSALASLFCFVVLLSGSAQCFAGKQFTVVIDAGHGGKDAGATGSVLKVKEKNINLSVALKLGEMIRKETDARVVYTRRTDVFVPLDERPKIANKVKADLFISIHANAAVNRSAFGTETYILGASSAGMEVAMRENSVILYEDDYEEKYEGFDPNSTESYIMFDYMQFAYSKQSLMLASMVQKKLARSGRTDRGVKQAGFLVLKHIAMPGILVELGYLSNEKEERYLSKEKSLKELAEAIFDAFVDYKDDFDKKNSSQQVKKEEKKPVEEVKEKPQEKVEEKKKEVSPEPRKEVTPTEPVAEAGVIYRVQFCSSVKQKPLDCRDFKMCVPAIEVKENNIFKYMYGEEKSFDDAAKLKKRIQVSFRDAFIVVFKDGVKLSPNESLKYLK